MASKPIIPVADLTTQNIADLFDERTIINDDLNMQGFKIYNLKNPVDDYDAVTKIYIDTKQYSLASANLTGNLPWSRIDNVPATFASKVSLLTVDQALDMSTNKITNLGSPTDDKDAVTKKYVDDQNATQNTIITQNTNNIATNTTNISNNTSSISTLNGYFTSGKLNLANLNTPTTANYVLLYDGTNIKWSLISGSNITTGSISTSAIANGSIGNSKIADVDWSKLNSKPGYVSLAETTTSGYVLCYKSTGYTWSYVDDTHVQNNILSVGKLKFTGATSLDIGSCRLYYQSANRPTFQNNDLVDRQYVDTRPITVTANNIQPSAITTMNTLAFTLGNDTTNLWANFGSPNRTNQGAGKTDDNTQNYYGDAGFRISGYINALNYPLSNDHAANKLYVDKRVTDYAFPKLTTVDNASYRGTMQSAITDTYPGLNIPSLAWSTSNGSRLISISATDVLIQRSSSVNLVSLIVDTNGTVASYGVGGFNGLCDTTLKESIRYKDPNEKDYFDRILNTPIMSFVYKSDTDKNIHVGTDAKKVYEIYNQNTGHINKTITNDNPMASIEEPHTCTMCTDSVRCIDCYKKYTYTVNTSAMTYYCILGQQSFYHQYYKPLKNKVESLEVTISNLLERLSILESKIS